MACRYRVTVAARALLLVFILKTRDHALAGMILTQLLRDQGNGFTAAHALGHQIMNSLYSLLLLFMGK